MANFNYDGEKKIGCDDVDVGKTEFVAKTAQKAETREYRSFL